MINNARTKQNNFINAVTVGNVLKYKRKEKKRVFALPYESHYVIMYYYTVSMLIDWNIKCDIYASLCVVKHCAFAVKTGESITVCIALDCIAVLMFVKLLEAPPTISGGGCSASIHWRVAGGGGSQPIELTLNYTRCLIYISLLCLIGPAPCFVWEVS